MNDINQKLSIWTKLNSYVCMPDALYACVFCIQIQWKLCITSSDILCCLCAWDEVYSHHYTYATYSWVPLLCCPIYHAITYSTAMTATEHNLDFELTTNTPNLTLMGELLVFIIRILKKFGCTVCLYFMYTDIMEPPFDIIRYILSIVCLR